MEFWIKRFWPAKIHTAFDRIELTYMEKDYAFEFCGNSPSTLKVRVVFSQIASFRWSDDFFEAMASPRPSEVPEIGGQYKGAYPFIEVNNSAWVASLDPDAFGNFQHFKLFSSRDIYDVIVQREPTIQLISE